MNTIVTVETVHGLKDVFVVGPGGTVDTRQKVVQLERESGDDAPRDETPPVRRATK